MRNDFGTMMPFKLWEESISSLKLTDLAVTPLAYNGSDMGAASGRTTGRNGIGPDQQPGPRQPTRSLSERYMVSECVMGVSSVLIDRYRYLARIVPEDFYDSEINRWKAVGIVKEERNAVKRCA